MQFFIFVLLICLLIFLYSVYVLANDDFIFLRRDVTMEKLFNIIFLGSLPCLFFARLFYGISHGNNILSNPFVFLLFPYYPGLSLAGGVVGAGVAFFFLKTRKKDPLPLGRIADFFSIAFLISLPIGFIGYLMFSARAFSAVKAGSQAARYFILFIIFLKFLLPRLLSGKFKEGSITYLFLIAFSTTSLVSNFVGQEGKLFSFRITSENFILIFLFIASMVLITRQERFVGVIRGFLKK